MLIINMLYIVMHCINNFRVKIPKLINFYFFFDKSQYDFEIPSKTVKLVHWFIIGPGDTTTLTLDFDVQESVHKIGNDRYILHPTKKVIQE